MAVTITADRDAFGIKRKYGVKYDKASKHTTAVKRNGIIHFGNGNVE